MVYKDGLLNGTSLIVVTMDDGIIMAADDLVYVEQNGKPIPRFQEVQKVFIVGQNVLIGSAGVMLYPKIKYKYDDWITALITSEASNSFNLPSDLASAIQDKARTTFKAEDIAKGSAWQTYSPGERFVSYAIAGYASSFQRPYIFEVGAEINADRTGLEFTLTHHRSNNVRLGEDKFIERAWHGVEPQKTIWIESVAEIKAASRELWPDLPDPLQEAIASVVGSVKIESQFNPDRVGNRVRAGVIARKEKKPYIAWL